MNPAKIGSFCLHQIQLVLEKPALVQLRSHSLLLFILKAAGLNHALRNGRLRINKSQRQQKRSYFT